VLIPLLQTNKSKQSLRVSLMRTLTSIRCSRSCWRNSRIKRKSSLDNLSQRDPSQGWINSPMPIPMHSVTSPTTYPLCLFLDPITPLTSLLHWFRTVIILQITDIMSHKSNPLWKNKSNKKSVFNNRSNNKLNLYTTLQPPHTTHNHKLSMGKW
jgi:hypothetical protein